MSGQVEYRDIDGFSGCRVGSDGTIWSCLVCGRPKMKYGPWRLRKLSGKPGGHLTVGLRATPNGKVKRLYVHRLVLEAFVGPCPPGMECCHNDGNPANNALSNLRWDTRGANIEDAVRHGTYLTGSRVHFAKLCEAAIPTIHRLRRMGLTYKQIGEQLGVSRGTVSLVVRGKTWRRVV